MKNKLSLKLSGLIFGLFVIITSSTLVYSLIARPNLHKLQDSNNSLTQQVNSLEKVNKDLLKQLQDLANKTGHPIILTPAEQTALGTKQVVIVPQKSGGAVSVSHPSIPTNRSVTTTTKTKTTVPPPPVTTPPVAPITIPQITTPPISLPGISIPSIRIKY